MKNRDDLIIRACKNVVAKYDTYLKSKRKHEDWGNNDEEWGLGSIRVRYDFKEGRLAKAAEDAYEEYGSCVQKLMSLLQEPAQPSSLQAAEDIQLKNCPKCGSGGLVAEFETAAGDYVNEYEITRCFSCDFKREKGIGGHCSEASNLFE